VVAIDPEDVASVRRVQESARVRPSKSEILRRALRLGLQVLVSEPESITTEPTA